MSEIAEIRRGHSRLLIWDRKGCHRNFSDVVGYLLGELEDTEPPRTRKRRQQDRENLRATLEAVVAELYAAYLDDPTLALGYSRNGNDYNWPNRYRSPVGSLVSMKAVADFLKGSGYVEHLPGFHRRAANPNDSWGNGGARSRFRAAPKLIALLQDTFSVQPDHIERSVQIGELVRLKNMKRELIDYTDDTNTNDMRNQLLEINEVLALANLELSNMADSLATDFTAKSLYRVFNDCRFDRGGRFYGGWWMNIKSEYRADILINGEPTVELDHSAFHPRLCYHLMGKEAPLGDLYAIEGLEGAREAVKWAFNSLTNMKAGQRMPRPKDAAKDCLSGKLTVPKLRKAVEEHFKDVGIWLASSRGTELQYIDSQMAGEVLSNLMGHGIICLPVHDSFIVSRKHEGVLREAMNSAYSKVLSLYEGALKEPITIIHNK